jgi:hypothetical protein
MLSSGTALAVGDGSGRHDSGSAGITTCAVMPASIARDPVRRVQRRGAPRADDEADCGLSTISPWERAQTFRLRWTNALLVRLPRTREPAHEEFRRWAGPPLKATCCDYSNKKNSCVIMMKTNNVTGEVQPAKIISAV